jgi:hypothetical protein
MARKIVCPVCDSERFRKVVVRLPSGRVRTTDFEACRRCATVFFRPEEHPGARDSTVSDYSWHMPANVINAITKSLPDPTLPTTADDFTEYYQHPDYGRVALVFRRMHKADGGAAFWHLDAAKRLVE